MPLTKKGAKILKKMQQTYGVKKGEDVFYASRNKGTITGVDPESSRKKAHKEYITYRKTQNAKKIW